ncbi:TPA: tetratricopeptide repeat protein [Candidatus Poribacteria bacterium]|nr:tetratricopeptide repeat protein [Candidatus Poribacteria bacterium]
MRSVRIGKGFWIELGLLILFLMVALLSLGSWARRTGGELPLGGEEYLVEADKFLAQGRMADAMVASWYARLKNPNLMKARYNIAVIYYRNRWTFEAMAELDEIIKRYPNNVAALLLKARILGEHGEIEKANGIYLNVIDIDPDNAEAHYYLGVNFQTSDPRTAERELRRAIECDSNLKPHILEDYPFGLKARLQLGRLLYNKGDLDGALTVLEEGYMLEPNYQEIKSQLVDYLKVKAQIYQTGHRDYSKSLQYYEKVVSIDPNDAEAWEWIGKINRYYLNDYEDALKAYKRAYELTKDPYLVAHIKEVELLLKGESR